MAKPTSNQIVLSFTQTPPNARDLMFCEDWRSFFMRQGNHYDHIEERKMQSILLNFALSNYPEANHSESSIKDMLWQLSHLTPNHQQSISTRYIALNDALLDTHTFELLDPSPSITTIYHIPVNKADLDKPTPAFDKFINETIVQKEKDENGNWIADQGLIKLTQEMFGYYLTDNLKAQKMFFLVGRGSNGKSKLSGIIEDLIGKKYVSNMTIQQLTTDKFATANLVGMKVNICTEAESKYIDSSKFKALVTGDSIQVERKYGQSFSFNPTTKYLFAYNDSPTFANPDYSLLRRIIIIKFNRVFHRHEWDMQLTEKLRTELGGILKWAIEGGKRLIENNYIFSETKQAEESMEEFKEEMSSAVKYFNETFVFDKENYIMNDDLYKDYKIWSEKNGRKALNATNFKKELKNNVKGFDECEGHKRIDGKFCRVNFLKFKNSIPEIDPDLQGISFV